MAALAFSNSLNGWAVGDSGIVLHTTDGGNSWLRQSSGTTNPLISLKLVDSSQLCLSGRKGTVRLTIDGGEEWRTVPTPISPPLLDLFFIDSLRGWIVSGMPAPEGVWGIVLKTTDGGSTWRHQVPDSIGGFQGVWFVDSLNGWVVGGKKLDDGFDSAMILHTTDGGDKWLEQSAPLVGPLRWIEFLTPTNGWAGGGSGSISTSLLHTVNGGENWQDISFQTGPLLTTEPVTDLCPIDTDYVWVTTASKVFLTTDGGQSWTDQTPPNAFGFLSVESVERSIAWLSDIDGHIWRIDRSTAVKDQPRRIDQSLVVATYPNPSNSSFTVSIAAHSSDPITMSLYSLDGRCVWQMSDPRPVNPLSWFVSVSSLSSGTYVLHVSQSNCLLSRLVALIK